MARNTRTSDEVVRETVRYQLSAGGIASAERPVAAWAASRNPLPWRPNPSCRGGNPMTSEDVLAPSTEADQLRQQLLQAQRLSSMGALASSVAHEFNNILTTIINYAKLGLRESSDEAARVEALERILKGSQRAATIVNSMLGYARNTVSQREMTDLVGLVEEVLILTNK